MLHHRFYIYTLQLLRNPWLHPPRAKSLPVCAARPTFGLGTGSDGLRASRLSPSASGDETSRAKMARQTPLSCPGHTRPVVHLHYSDITPSGFYFISASKGNHSRSPHGTVSTHVRRSSRSQTPWQCSACHGRLYSTYNAVFVLPNPLLLFELSSKTLRKTGSNCQITQ